MQLSGKAVKLLNKVHCPDLEELNDRICDIYEQMQEVLREREEKENA